MNWMKSFKDQIKTKKVNNSFDDSNQTIDQVFKILEKTKESQKNKKTKRNRIKIQTENQDLAVLRMVCKASDLFGTADEKILEMEANTKKDQNEKGMKRIKKNMKITDNDMNDDNEYSLSYLFEPTSEHFKNVNTSNQNKHASHDIINLKIDINSNQDKFNVEPFNFHIFANSHVLYSPNFNSSNASNCSVLIFFKDENEMQNGFNWESNFENTEYTIYNNSKKKINFSSLDEANDSIDLRKGKKLDSLVTNYEEASTIEEESKVKQIDNNTEFDFEGFTDEIFCANRFVKSKPKLKISDIETPQLETLRTPRSNSNSTSEDRKRMINNECDKGYLSATDLIFATSP